MILGVEDGNFWIALFGFLGILVTQVVLYIQQRGNKKKITDTQDQVSDIHEEVKAPNGDKTGHNVDRMRKLFDRHMEQSKKEHQEFMIELHSMATTLGLHMADGHDPIRNMTRDPNARTRESDKKES